MKASLFGSLSRVAASLTVALLTAPLLASCGGGTMTPEWPKGNIVLHDTNNFTSVTKLTLPVIQTAPGADLMVCWDGLTKDLLCHDIEAPANAIDNVSFLQIPSLSHDDVAAKLAIGQLDEALVKVYRDHHVDSAATTKCANIGTFILGTSMLNPAVDYTEPASGKTVTYMLLFETGTTPGVGSRAMTFLEPTSTSTETTVNAPDACANKVLDFKATLGAPIAIPAMDNTKWHIDWSQITKDSFGNKVSFNKIDNVLLGFYQGKTKDDLMAQFTDIEQIATTLYEVPVAQGARDVDLKNAKLRSDGTTMFPGFSSQTDGVWAIAVTCGKCQVPAPVALTILQPE
jgi:hypothetical protein